MCKKSSITTYIFHLALNQSFVEIQARNRLVLQTRVLVCKQQNQFLSTDNQSNVQLNGNSLTELTETGQARVNLRDQIGRAHV